MTGKRSGQSDRLRIEVEALKTEHAARSAPHGCNDGLTVSDHGAILPFQYGDFSTGLRSRKTPHGPF